MDSPTKHEQGDASQIENVPEKSKRGRFITHLKRFWWIYVILAICGIVLAVPLVIFVGVKNIAQSKINHAVLGVQGISCTNTTSGSFNLAINTTLKSGKTKATVHAFEGVMYLEDEPSHAPFAHITFPETKNKPFQTVNISQSVNITDVKALTTFNTWLLNNETLRVTVQGNPKVSVPGISHKYGVNFKKTITIPGLNGFSGMSVSDNSISASTFSDGTNFHTTVVIPNKSFVTFEIGNVTFENFLNGSSVGTSYIDNVFLVPGNNTYALRALINQVATLTAVDSEPWCKDGIVPYLLSGRTVNNHGQSLPYFADALASHNSSVDIDLGTPLRAIGINPKCPSS